MRENIVRPNIVVEILFTIGFLAVLKLVDSNLSSKVKSQKILNTQIAARQVILQILLCISGIDAIENRKIYETYMHFGQISYSGKKAQGLGHLKSESKPLYITSIVRKRYSQYT
jgi:hypothetical protein